MPCSTTVPRLSGAARWQQRSASAAARPSRSRNSTTGSLQMRRPSGASPTSSPHAAMYQELRANIGSPPIPAALSPHGRPTLGRREAAYARWLGDAPGGAAEIGQEHGQQPNERQEGADAVDRVDAGGVGKAAERRRADPGHPEAEAEEEAGHRADLARHQVERVDDNRRRGRG